MISERYTAWRTSRHSDGSGNCVEVAGAPGSVAVRDSKDRVGPRLEFSTSEWAAFLGRARKGVYDHLLRPTRRRIGGRVPPIGRPRPS
jgi:hypothetical protein